MRPAEAEELFQYSSGNSIVVVDRSASVMTSHVSQTVAQATTRPEAAPAEAPIPG